MWDFLTGFLMGRQISKYKERKMEEELQFPELSPITITPIEEIVDLPKVIKYVPIPEIYDFQATLGKSYEDYEKTNLVLICDHGHRYYYSEVEVNETQTTWGNEQLIDRI